MLAAGLLFLVAALRGRPLWPRNRGEWWFLFATGTLSFTVNYAGLFWGEQHIPSGQAAVLQATIPGFGLLFAHLHLPAERLSAGRVLGALVGFAGVGVIFFHELHVTGALALWGSAAVVLGAATVAWGNVLVKARGGGFDPLVLAGWQMVMGLVPLLLAGWWTEGRPWEMRWTPAAVGCLVYLAVIGSCVAFSLYYWLVRHMAVTRIMTIALVTPVFAVALGWGGCGEPLSWLTRLGALAVGAGAGVMMRPAPPTAARSAEMPGATAAAR